LNRQPKARLNLLCLMVLSDKCEPVSFAETFLTRCLWPGSENVGFSNGLSIASRQNLTGNVMFINIFMQDFNREKRNGIEFSEYSPNYMRGLTI
jgi:hypothetical protein